jgi:hypothetical protein
MIVIYKNERGSYSVRPAFIGFIKNNIVRRVLMTIFYPFVITASIAINLFQSIYIFIFSLLHSVLMLISHCLKSIYYPLSLMTWFDKDPIWHKPRLKETKDINK